MSIKSTGENAYFVASNSSTGFISYYEEVFRASRIGHIWAIKGGPGTGKSRFLREVSKSALDAGWACEYIYCSSDPNSLDAVILTHEGKEGIALLDATAPHLFEPLCPGAREDIINLGQFWNVDLLALRREEIEQLNREKGNAYRRAYRYLSGFGDMRANRDSLVAPFINRARIAAQAQKLLRDLADGESYSAQPALIHSVGMRGEVGFDTYFCEADEIYIVADCHGAAQYLMMELGKLATEKKLTIRLSHDPVEAEKIDGIFFCGSGIAVVVCPEEECDYPHHRICMRRFVDTASMKRVRRELRFNDRISRALKGEAIDALEKVREVHFRLEDIYSAAMDFSAKEAFTKAFCEKLFQV
jgi:hypothetical protein